MTKKFWTIPTDWNGTNTIDLAAFLDTQTFAIGLPGGVTLDCVSTTAGTGDGTGIRFLFSPATVDAQLRWNEAAAEGLPICPSIFGYTWNEVEPVSAAQAISPTIPSDLTPLRFIQLRCGVLTDNRGSYSTSRDSTLATIPVGVASPALISHEVGELVFTNVRGFLTRQQFRFMGRFGNSPVLWPVDSRKGFTAILSYYPFRIVRTRAPDMETTVGVEDVPMGKKRRLGG